MEALRNELTRVQSQHKKATKSLAVQHRQEMSRLERDADTSQSLAAEWKARCVAGSLCYTEWCVVNFDFRKALTKNVTHFAQRGQRH